MKKKILYIVEAFGGGIFTYIVEMANAISKKFDVYIAYGIRKQTPENFQKYFNHNINLISVKHFDRTINPFNDINAFFEIKKIVKTIKPDLIHLHSSKSGVLGRFAVNGKKIPIFYTPHGYSFLMMNHSSIKRKIYKLVEFISSKRSCMTISCSYGEHKETLKFNSNAMYVNNGINLDDFKSDYKLPETHLKKKVEIKVFTIGRICYQKNPQLYNSIAEHFPKIKFIWIGDGELKSLLTSKNITITGWLSRDKAMEIAESADIFILTSLWEGLPISLLEAMYMKRNIVVSNVIGNNDVINNGVNGFVCDDLENFKKSINYIVSHDCSNLENNAYNDVLSIYNIDVMSKKYLEIYQNAIDKSKKMP